MSRFWLRVCHVVLWIVLPLHKAIWVFVYTLLYSLCTWQSNRWRVVERHKEAKTHSLSSSQPAPRSKRFSQACPQTCAISHISGLHRLFLSPIRFSFFSAELCTFKVRPCRAKGLCFVFLYSTTVPAVGGRSGLLRINRRLTATITHFLRRELSFWALYQTQHVFTHVLSRAAVGRLLPL